MISPPKETLKNLIPARASSQLIPLVPSRLIISLWHQGVGWAAIQPFALPCLMSRVGLECLYGQMMTYERMSDGLQNCQKRQLIKTNTTIQHNSQRRCGLMILILVQWSTSKRASERCLGWPREHSGNINLRTKHSNQTTLSLQF